MSPTLVILLVGSCVGASCALVGSFLVLRKMALLGDAISHAVLPGIALAFLISGSRSPGPMIVGAASLGVVTVFLVGLAHRTRLLKEDASIGVVFPALFSIGVILISRYAGQVDLDLDCVLYGEIAYTPWDLWLVGDHSLGPKALWVNGAVLAIVLALVLATFKELKLSTFDPELAATLGFSPVLLHYLLMTAVSVTVVGAFESVGAILVVAMLIVPPATAYLLTDRLGVMLALAAALGVAAAVLGYAVARALDASIAGAMASVAGLFFAAAFLFSRHHGLLARVLRHRRLSQAMAEQLVLLHLRHDTRGVPADTLRTRFAWGEVRLRRTIDRLLERGWIVERAAGFCLTDTGLEAIERAGQFELRHRLGAGPDDGTAPSSDATGGGHAAQQSPEPA